MISQALADKIIAKSPGYHWEEPNGTLSILMWAIAESWPDTMEVDSIMKALTTVRPASIDVAFTIARFKGYKSGELQKFKSDRLFPHITEAVLFIENQKKEKSMTPEEKIRMFALLEKIVEQNGQLLAQFGPSPVGSTPTDKHWPSWGLNADGEQLTFRDGLLVKLDKLIDGGCVVT